MLVGGQDDWVTNRSLARLDPQSLAWSEIATAGVARGNPGLVRLDGDRWLVVGGLMRDDHGVQQATSFAEIVDLQRRTVTAAAPAPFATSDALVARLPDGRAIVAGGDEFTREAAFYDPIAGVWSAAPELPRRYAGAQLAVPVGDRFVVWLGGFEDFDPPPSPVALAYDAHASLWQELPLSPALGVSLVALPSLVRGEARVLVSGGRDDRGVPTAEMSVLVFTARS